MVWVKVEAGCRVDEEAQDAVPVFKLGVWRELGWDETLGGGAVSMSGPSCRPPKSLPQDRSVCLFIMSVVLWQM